VVVALTQLSANWVARFFEGGAELAVLFRIIGLAAALSMPAIVLRTSTASYESFVPANVVAAGTQLLRGALLFGCIAAGWGVTAMGWALLVVSFASLLGNSVVFKSVCRDAHLSWKAVRWDDLKMLLSFGSVLLIVNTANSLATDSPKQIVAKTISLDALGLFGIPLLLIGYYRMSIITITKVFSPRFSYLAGGGAQDEMRRLFVRGSRLLVIFAGAVAIGLLVVGPPFLLLWTHKPAIMQTAPGLMVMVAGTFVFLSHRLGGDLLFGLGKQRQIAFLELVEALGIVGLTIGLSLRFGMTGAAFGLALPPLVVRGWLQTRYVCEALQLGFWEYYHKCVLRSWVAVAVVLAAAHLLGLSFVVKGWPSLLLVSSLLMVLYGACVYLWVLEKGERRQLEEKASRLCAKLGVLRPA
jgi:O-antigen/teichoic acid export membrane protein